MRRASLGLLLAFFTFSGILMAFGGDEHGRREEYQKQTEARLQAIEQKFATLKARSAGLTESASARLEEDMALFKEKEKAAAVRLQHLKGTTAKAWERGRSGVDAALQDLSRQYERMEARFTSP